MRSQDPDRIVGLDPRFKVGEIVFTENLLAYEIQLDPVRPMLSGNPGRSTNGVLFKSLDSEGVKCRFTLATQRGMLTAAQASALRASTSRETIVADEDDLIPIF